MRPNCAPDRRTISGLYVFLDSRDNSLKMFQNISGLHFKTSLDSGTIFLTLFCRHISFDQDSARNKYSQLFRKQRAKSAKVNEFRCIMLIPLTI